MCFDEWGPLEIKPIGGVAWAPRNQPQRMRATYRRLKGTEQFFGFYDVHADCLDGLFRKRKRLPEIFEAFQRLRRCYPGKKLYVIMDNLRQVHATHASSRCSSGFASIRCGPRPKPLGSI